MILKIIKDVFLFRIEMANNGMSLTLHNAHRNHSGLYVCAVSKLPLILFGRIKSHENEM